MRYGEKIIRQDNDCFVKGPAIQSIIDFLLFSYENLMTKLDNVCFSDKQNSLF